MSKTHKFLLAATLLAGGYGVALLLGSLSSWIVPQSADHAVASAPGGTLVPMNANDVPAPPALPLQQVPVTSMQAMAEPRQNVSPVAPPIPVPPLNAPTWLAAEPGADATPIVLADPPPAKPLAKVTNISPWGTSTAAADASPWDRWPQWDPGSTTSNDTVKAPLGGAAQAQSTIQASYQPSQPLAEDADGAPGNSHLRTHIVVDGDSLSKLADRYLDDPQLANEIYELNRGTLTSPELLPIGVELRIPERQMAKDQMASTSQRAIEVSSMQGPRVPNQFEPVGNWLDAANDVPRAQLLQPVPIGRNE